MRKIFRTTNPHVWVCLALLGCDRPQTSEYGYWPDPATAERALVLSLEGWLAKPPGPSVPPRDVRVETWDSGRAERRLEGYQVLGPVGGPDERIYAVRLSLADPSETQVAQYVVRGIDPIWVFRRDDYDRISHWEHLMTDAEAQKQQELVPPGDPPAGHHPAPESAVAPSSIYRGDDEPR